MHLSLSSLWPVEQPPGGRHIRSTPAQDSKTLGFRQCRPGGLLSASVSELHELTCFEVHRRTVGCRESNAKNEIKRYMNGTLMDGYREQTRTRGRDCDNGGGGGGGRTCLVRQPLTNAVVRGRGGRRLRRGRVVRSRTRLRTNWTRPSCRSCIRCTCSGTR